MTDGMTVRDPVHTPEMDSLEGVVAHLEEELANLRHALPREQQTARSAEAGLRRARIRADELQSALEQKEEQFRGMLARLQDREEQAVRRAAELAERTEEAESARARAEEAEGQLRRLVGEAGKLMGASLDPHAALASVTRFAVPELADWCVIDVVDEHGSVERVAAAAGREEDGELARRLVDECEPGGDYGVQRALRRWPRPTAQEVDDALLRDLACRDDLIDEVRGLDLRSALIVPLLARGQLIGAMALLTRSRREPPSADDLLLAQELARRAAMAVDNARLYDAALAGSRAKTEFLAVISHELRTPLSAIIGYADLLRTGVTGEVNASQEEQLGRIRASADHLLELIEAILAYAQLEAGHAELNTAPLDAAEITREVVDFMRPLAERKDLELKVEGADQPIRITGDRRKIRQILLNLVSNAVKFTEDGGVRIALESIGARARWQIADTGIGIEPHHIEAIFTPFWQVEQSRTRRNEGSGLGLSVSRGLAQLMAGSLDVESHVGVGTTFTFEIPATPPRLPPPAET